MLEKFAILSDKLISYGINKFVVDYRYFSSGGIRSFGTNLESIYDNGFKLVDIEKGYCLFEKDLLED
jgi:poly-gamma-glutamate capsule biosynthesis protein CapA/YwtB (metallophosphatase superfamily)